MLLIDAETSKRDDVKRDDVVVTGEKAITVDRKMSHGSNRSRGEVVFRVMATMTVRRGSCSSVSMNRLTS